MRGGHSGDLWQFHYTQSCHPATVAGETLLFELLPSRILFNLTDVWSPSGELDCNYAQNDKKINQAIMLHPFYHQDTIIG